MAYANDFFPWDFFVVGMSEADYLSFAACYVLADYAVINCFQSVANLSSECAAGYVQGVFYFCWLDTMKDAAIGPEYAQSSSIPFERFPCIAVSPKKNLIFGNGIIVNS